MQSAYENIDTFPGPVLVPGTFRMRKLALLCGCNIYERKSDIIATGISTYLQACVALQFAG